MPSLKNKPFVKMFTLVGDGPLKNQSQENIEFIARTYDWINSHGGRWLSPVKDWRYFAGKSGNSNRNYTSLGERLRKINPNIILTNYRNGAYTNQDALAEAFEVEKKIPLSIAVHNTQAQLVNSISASETTILLFPPETVPENVPPIYPFRASTTNGIYSRDKSAYVGWIRLEDEIIRINKAEISNEGHIKLTVERGYWQTKAAPHPCDVPVLQPIYCGSLREDGEEYYLSGLPEGNSPQRALRYVLMQHEKEVWAYLGDKVEEVISEGLNGPWLDCTCSNWINYSNAYGVQAKRSGPPVTKIIPYAFARNKPVDYDTYREYQQMKLDYLFKRFPGGEFYINWVFPQHYFTNGTEKLMFSGENGYHPVSGGAIEMYANDQYMNWLELMRMQLDVVKNNYRVVSWVKKGSNEVGGDDYEMEEEYQLFAYGTYLLAYEPGGDQYWGGQWRPGNSLHGQFDPPSFVYWDLGEPEEHFDCISEAKRGEGLYCRKYSKGLVVVNPDLEKTNKTRFLKLENQYFQPETGCWTNQAVIPPQSARLLLKP